MATSGDGRAEEVSRRDSFGGLPSELGQDLPDAPRRPKCDDPAVAAAVIVNQQDHRDAIFGKHDGKAALNARSATTKTFKGLDWGAWFAGGEETLSFVDPPATKKRPTLKTPPSAGPKARDSAVRAAPRKKVSKD